MRCLVTGIALVAVGAAALVPTACRQSDVRIEDILAAYQDEAVYSGLTIRYPLDETLFPPEIAPPTFRWDEGTSESDTWLITMRFPDDQGRMNFLSRERTWTPETGEWEAIKKRSLEKKAQVAILGVNHVAPRKILSGHRITIRTSGDEVGAPILYRDVNLPFRDAVKDPSHIRWRFGAVSSLRPPPVVLENLPVCGNCHSFCKAGKTLAMDVDYANSKGSYVITRVAKQMVLATSDIITWNEYRKEDGEQTFGLLSQISPDGKYVVSTVKDKSVFVPRSELAFSQLFFPIKGILCVYDRATGTFSALPGADNPQYVQSNPSWSPDGQYIVFARSKAYDLKNTRSRGKLLLTAEECREFVEDGKPFLFDLYRIPFNGGNGGRPEPLEGASHNGMSNFFARYSPDGKWIVFCKAKSYMLLQPDSELYIMPAEGGEPRRLRCNTSRMNSWHSWSPNGKWLVFASKAYSAYTQLFLTHIDDQGRSSPAVLLSRFTAADRAANIPEFVNASPTAIQHIREQFLDDYSFVRAGDAFYRAGDAEDAIEEYRNALNMNPNNVVAHQRLGFLLYNIRQQPDEGLRHTREVLRLDPENVRALCDYGMAMLDQKKPEEAIRCLSRVLQLMPDDLDTLYTRASVQCILGQAFLAERKFAEATACLSEAVRLEPTNTRFHGVLATALMAQKRMEEAAVHLSEAVRLEPTNAEFHWALAQVLLTQEKMEKAVFHLSEAIRLDPNNAQRQYAYAQMLAGAGDIDGAVRHYAQAIELNPAVDTSPELHDILGANYARAGRFREAVLSARKARELARAAGKTALEQEIQKRIELYERKASDRSPRSP